MKYQEIILQRDNQVATIILNRPEKRNALSLRLLEELINALQNFYMDKETRVVIINGAGPCFSAGHDLSEMVDKDIIHYKKIFETCSDMMKLLQKIPQPTIAQVHGVAMAAGCQMVAACDLAVAEEGARFNAPGVRIGLFCITPSVPLSRAIGRKRALEMLFTGNFINANEALKYGLINRVVPLDQLEAATQELIESIVSSSPLTISIGKQAFYTQINMPDDQAYDYATNTITLDLATHDAQEGISAFLEKRTPKWKGK
ncbi:MAG: enoyl-CoA hydratase [Candidatus Heimdallarchaeota archaeon]